VTRRLSIRRALWLSVFGPSASVVALMSRWAYLHYRDADFYLDILNFAVVLLPFAFSILFAFVPDMRNKHIAWRTLVIAVGVLFSVLLWKQQHLASDAAKRDQRTAITEAVKESNQHSDQQIGGVRSDVREVQKNLESTASKVDLSKTADVITTILSKSQADLTEKINKMKPEHSDTVKIQFSIFPQAGNTAPLPILTSSIAKAKDETYSVEVFFGNTSATAAENLDIWIELCKDCSFASEPPGMDKPPGTNEHIRHRIIPLVNPGAQFEKTSLSVKAGPNPPFKFEVGFRYACKACGIEGARDTQKVTFLALPMPPS